MKQACRCIALAACFITFTLAHTAFAQPEAAASEQNAPADTPEREANSPEHPVPCDATSNQANEDRAACANDWDNIDIPEQGVDAQPEADPAIVNEPTRADIAADDTDDAGADDSSAHVEADGTNIESALDEEDDRGRGWFYLRLQGGLSYANIVAFSDANFLPEANTIFGAGGTGGISVGLRLFIISIGVQATYAAHSEFNLGTVGLDAGIYLPLRFASPYLRLGLGYAWVANADAVPTEVGDVDVYGLFLELGLGLDVYVHKHIAIGAGFDGIFLSLSRQAAGDFNVLDVRFEEDGDAVGIAIRAQLRVTFSF